MGQKYETNICVQLQNKMKHRNNTLGRRCFGDEMTDGHITIRT